MNKNNCKAAVAVVGNIMRKVGESALHAAVFAYVSKKVSNMMSKDEKCTNKVRVENESSEQESTERI